MSARRSSLAALAMAVVVAAGILAGAPAAQACGAGEVCPPPSSGGDSGSSGQVSDGTRSQQYSTPRRSCSVYANGGTMGSYCVTPGEATKTLRERFGDQKLQLCRYAPIPAGIPEPYNANPDEGRYLLMTCLGGIDLDTYAGGRDRQFNISIVFVPYGTDIDDIHNGITDFLWNSINDAAKMPVPVMLTQPNPTPVVGVPTYFTFRWIDPGTKDVVAQGKYAGRANGGPFVSIVSRGLVMQAQARKIVIDPNQKDLKAVTCGPETPYRPKATAAEQPDGACSITFPRSSASARKLATREIPANVKDAFYASVQVTWHVTYGEQGGEMRDLGDFTMRLSQVLPVQEIQTPNQPPAVIY